MVWGIDRDPWASIKTEGSIGTPCVWKNAVLRYIINICQRLDRRAVNHVY
jgi:hypothetical protein